MTPSGVMRLGKRSTRICHSGPVSVNSASACAPFGKRQIPPWAKKGWARSRSRGSGANARAVIRGAGVRPEFSARIACTRTGARVMRETSRRKAALRWSASTRSNGIPVASARIRPGKPAPEPRSIPRMAPEQSGASCRLSAMCRSQITPSSARPTRLTVRFQRNRASTNGANVARGTLIGGKGGTWHTPAQVGGDRCQGGRGHPLNAGGGAQRFRTDAIKLAPQLR